MAQPRLHLEQNWSPRDQQSLCRLYILETRRWHPRPAIPHDVRLQLRLRRAWLHQSASTTFHSEPRHLRITREEEQDLPLARVCLRASHLRDSSAYSLRHVVLRVLVLFIRIPSQGECVWAGVPADDLLRVPLYVDRTGNRRLQP